MRAALTASILSLALACAPDGPDRLPASDLDPLESTDTVGQICPDFISAETSWGEMWTFATDEQCEILCEGAELVCPVGLECESSLMICVQPG